jgi:hypothetical protein
MRTTPDLARVADAVAPRPSRRDSAQSAARHLGSAAAALTASRGHGRARSELARTRTELRRTARRQSRRPRPLAVFVAIGSAAVATAAVLAARAFRAHDDSAAAA